MKPKEARSKVIDGILASRTDCKECKPVYEKYQKIFFKKTKEKVKQEHPEVARYEKAAAYLAKHPDDKDSTQKELQEEQEKLLSEIAELKVPLTEVQAVSYTHLFTTAVSTMSTLVVALGGGVGVWGVFNLMEGYGSDNPASKSHGVKQFMAN